MASVTLRRATQRLATINHSKIQLYRSTVSRSAAPATRSQLYEADTIRLPRTPPSVTKLNNGLEIRARDTNIPGLVHFWNDMLKKGITPDGTSYLILLKLYAQHRLYGECVKVFDDMVTMGVGDKLQALNLIVLSAIEDNAHFFEALSIFSKYDLSPDTTTYEYHLLYLDRTDNLERAMQLLDEMHTKGIPLNKECMRIVISMAARLNMPTLAMELAINSKDVVGPMDDIVNVSILMSAAASLNAEVTQWAWNLIPKSTTLTEPLCIDILNLTNRHGLPNLALSVLEYFLRQRITLQEHHLAPLIGSYCAAPTNRKVNLREAFLALGKFQEYGVEILPESTEALVNVIGKSTTTLDEAYDILLELPRPVSVDAVNATLQAAAITLGDLPRAIGIYKDISNLQCTPTTQTFDILLAGCLKASHRALGERLFSEMLSLGLTPSVQTYTRLILLSLTETTYESAFERLEEMKGQKMTPPLSVYDALVRRLVNEKDSRADLALEDMEHCGYRISPSLRDFLLGNEGADVRRTNRKGNGAQHGRYEKRQNERRSASAA
ncbi:hypothetical protein FRC12_004391 [Ceratobasidium sp. 428]|nr:hypothetical protein FRC12_004391 [Ceratobasidium sp. 428]